MYKFEKSVDREAPDDKLLSKDSISNSDNKPIKSISMKCPNCNETLVMTDRQGVEIDYCPVCRGVWLDKGELDKIIERGASELNAPDKNHYVNPPQQNYGHQADHSSHYKHSYQKKRKGFLGEMFDF